MAPAEVAVTLPSDDGCVGSLRCTTRWSVVSMDRVFYEPAAARC